VIVILVALGANLSAIGGRQPGETCLWAAQQLAILPELRLDRVATWLRSPSEPPGAPDYVNGIARLEGPADPAGLLAALHRIEAAAGRARPYPNAPRTLDLDLIDLDGLVRDAPDPVLPHPRAHLRRFVLQPLAEVAPGWVHPRLGITVEALLAALPGPALPSAGLR
jgi:2-amino-4-hydroxy-6-hydroxymethyldihydropteridine diphosphokinase